MGGALVISIFNDRVLTKVSTFQLLRKKSQGLNRMPAKSALPVKGYLIVFVNIVSVICHDLIHYHPTVRKAGEKSDFLSLASAKNNGLPPKSQIQTVRQKEKPDVE